MTIPLRPLSPRPELLVDQRSGRVVDEGTGQVGRPGPFGRDRLITALATNKAQPVQLVAPVLLRDNQGCLIADPDGNVVGVGGLWCHRMIYASRTMNTRRL